MSCQDAEDGANNGTSLSDKLLPVRTLLSALQQRHFTRPQKDSKFSLRPGLSPIPGPSPGPVVDPARPLLRLHQRVYLKFCGVQGRVWDLTAYALSQQGRYREAAEAVTQSIEAMTRPFLDSAMYVGDN